MTETEYSNNVKLAFQAEQFKQLELLYEVFILRTIRKKLRKKLESLEKMIKGEINKEISKKVEAFKIVSMENNVKFEKLVCRLKTSNNIFKLVRELENNEKYLNNLNKERKKGRIDAEQYEITRGYYLQKMIDIHEAVNRLKDIAITYYQELKDKLIMLEDNRIRLTTEKLRKRIAKEDFNQRSSEIETLKHQIEEKLAFLKVELIDLEID